jgi:hypothetical protein
VTPTQLYALRSPLDTFDPIKIAQRRTIRPRGLGELLVVILAVDR